MELTVIIAFIFMFGALVFVHELGHLIFAKRAGILCREFAIGMGPKLFSWTRNETLYTLRALPIGGYVKMAGEDPEALELKPGQQIGFILNDQNVITKIITSEFDKFPTSQVLEVEAADLEHQLFIRFLETEDKQVTYTVDPKATYFIDGSEYQIAPYNRQFNSKSVPKRAMALFAGPMMNFIFAFLLFIAIGFMQGVPTGEPALGTIIPDSAAEQYGLKEGDQVKAINGKPVDSWESVVSSIQKYPDETVPFEIMRDGETITKEVKVNSVESEGKEIGQIGVYAPTEKSPAKVITSAAQQTYMWSTQIFIAVGDMFTGGFSVDNLAGPVGIYSATKEVVNTGFSEFLTWTAVLSVNLGIINLLPLPALDGGRLLFLGIEGVRGKPISREKESIVHFVGFALLMLLMIAVTWNDIQRLFS